MSEMLCLRENAIFDKRIWSHLAPALFSFKGFLLQENLYHAHAIYNCKYAKTLRQFLSVFAYAKLILKYPV